MIRKKRHISAKKGKAQQGAKVASSRKHGLKSETKKWIILISLSILVSLLLSPDILIRPRTYVLGDVADRDIKATRDFLVENEALTQEKKQKHAEQ